jgi:hypothetical protein
LAPKFPEAPSWSAKISGRRGSGKSALRSIRTFVPTPSPPSPPGEGMGGSRGRPPRLPPGFRGQDRAASAPLCPLKPGIGRGRPGRSGRVIPGRNPAGSPGFAWGRRVQGRAFPGEDRVEAGEIGPAQGVGVPVCPFSERRTFAVWRMGEWRIVPPTERRIRIRIRGWRLAAPRHRPVEASGKTPPGASRIHPGFRGQKGRTEAGFCPLKAGGVPGQGPGASRSREAAPGLPRDAPGANRAFARPFQGPRRVFAGFSPGGEGGEGAGIGRSARIRTAKDLDDPAR